MEAITTAVPATDKPLSAYTPAELKAHLYSLEKSKGAGRDAYKALVEETVPEAMKTLLEASETLTVAKAYVFDYFRNILALKSDVFGVKEKQQGHTFSTKDFTVIIGFRQTDGWDDTVTAGIQKVNNFIQSLATDDNSAKLVETINRLLNRDAKGNLKASRVVELKNLTAKFNNDDFTDGVEIIQASYKPVRSCWYIEAYRNNENGSKTPIPLSMSAVEFPEGFEFDFFNDLKQESDATIQ